MRRVSTFLIGIVATAGFAFSNANLVSASAQEHIYEVYVGGMPAGFTLSAGGAQIIGVCEVMTEAGPVSPASKAGIRAGDIIFKVAGIEVNSVGELNEILNKNKEKETDFSVKRGEEELSFRFAPVKDKTSERYKIGVLVRDNVSGIGTVTYINKENGRFGSLGHSVVGEDKREMKIAGGKVYGCSIVGIAKGVRGRAGELRGMFLSDISLGTAEKLCDSGIYGYVSENYDLTNLIEAKADSGEVKPGKAYVYSTVNGICPKKYSIEIVKVDKNNRSNKNYVIKITDDELIDETGGIVQGMSGSPILQEGKLVGAVTHVFLNDPTRGYGIDIKKMITE
ncbi:MAG: PDZ domain-containing protein [Clostridia bacterium]|nr:PDZ domain-containing protein [Clostridia bacterium]